MSFYLTVETRNRNFVASLKDPKKLFNSSFEGNTRPAINLGERKKINEAALK